MIRLIAALLLLLPSLAAAQPRVIEGADPAIWQGEATSGPLLHRESGVTLPETIGNFRRFRFGGLSSTDSFANYSYERDGKESLVTVFLFRPGTLPEHRLFFSIAAIGARSQGAFLWSDGPFLIGSEPDLRGYKGTFKTGFGPDTIMDYVYFVPLGNWTVKVRASVQSPGGVEHEREVDSLVRALPWDQIHRAGGSCTGWACRLDTAFPVNSNAMEGSPALLGGSGERRVVYSQRGYRLVELAGSPVAAILGATFGAVSVRDPLYAVETGTGGGARVVRFFSGLPTEEQFKQTVRLLRQHPGRSAIVSPLEAAYHSSAIEPNEAR